MRNLSTTAVASLSSNGGALNDFSSRSAISALSEPSSRFFASRSNRRFKSSEHTVPSGPQWAYEIKHDGYRFICRRDTYGVLAAGENKMAFAIGLLIFAAVIGSHGFLWWSCSRHGG